ncbi:MAG: cytochrome c, partial [Balneolaceae bacterium]|nr:cytochrome c [Balneolaceae bacterium]
TTESGLTEFEMENGIGPVDEKMELSSIDPSMAKKGEKLFETKCSACHKMGERYVGPAQGDLLERRTPEFIMNMILNPDEMVKKHPEAKKLLAQFMTPMPNQNLSREEARAVLEYFRYVDSTGTEQVSLPE